MPIPPVPIGLFQLSWLVGCFGLNGPFRQYFSLYRAVPQREGERKEVIDEKKNVKPLRWSGGAMVLGKRPVPGRPTILIRVGQGPTALAVGAGGVVWTFLLLSISYLFSHFLWETVGYRLKYCLKGPLNPKQPTN